jgi:hypothetical protein
MTFSGHNRAPPWYPDTIHPDGRQERFLAKTGFLTVVEGPVFIK